MLWLFWSLVRSRLASLPAFLLALGLAATTCARLARGPLRPIPDCEAALGRYYLSYASLAPRPLMR